MILLGVIYICHEVYILCFIILANEIASTVNQLWRNCLQENLSKKNCPVPPPPSVLILIRYICTNKASF